MVWSARALGSSVPAASSFSTQGAAGTGKMAALCSSSPPCPARLSHPLRDSGRAVAAGTKHLNAEPAQSLLEYLRAELYEPGLGYIEPLTPITGGYDTQIFAFRLSGAPKPFSIPLILRILGSQHPPARALSERATQNAVAGLGYPAPRVLLASPDPTILGGAFLVMERLAGRPLLDAQRLGVASGLVEMQLRLHALDAEGLLLALDRAGPTSSAAGEPPISRQLRAFDGHLARLERRIARGSLRRLEEAMAWVSDHPAG